MCVLNEKLALSEIATKVRYIDGWIPSGCVVNVLNWIGLLANSPN